MNAPAQTICDRALAMAKPDRPVNVDHPRLVLATTILASILAFIDGTERTTGALLFAGIGWLAAFLFVEHRKGVAAVVGSLTAAAAGIIAFVLVRNSTEMHIKGGQHV